MMETAVTPWRENASLNINRLLQDDEDGTEDAILISNDLFVLRHTIGVYGGVFVGIFLVFCWARRVFPRVFRVRSWLVEWKTPLAGDLHGFFNWFWRLRWIEDTEMLDECGLDAVCLIRVLQFGLKISGFGMVNALWLIPVYVTAEKHPETDSITDPIVLITTSHIPPGSLRFIATAVASYLLFGYVMFCVLREFSWFYIYRHRFLSAIEPRNYAVYVRNIPEEYRSNAKLYKFFCDTVSQNTVMDVRTLVKTPVLKKKVAYREKLVRKLEHAINKEDIKGHAPMTWSKTQVGKRVNVIETKYKELVQLNKEISYCITNIEKSDDSRSMSTNNTFAERSETNESLPLGGYESESDESDISTVKSKGQMKSKKSHRWHPESMPKEINKITALPLRGIQELAGDEVKEFTALPLRGIKTAAHAAKGLIFAEDGALESSAFVTFKSIRSVQAALQLLHHPEPYAMEVIEAPSPKDVNWENTGLSHEEVEGGKMTSFILTCTLCVFWAFPAGFVGSLADMQALRSQIEVVDDLLNYAPWFGPFIEVLAPLLILELNEILMVILEKFSQREGPISGAIVEASLFQKLSVFLIVHSFFVSALSSSLFAAISEILNDPFGDGVTLLGKVLPTKSTLFIQIILADTCVGIGMEILRVRPVLLAILRSFIGPSLTEKERDTSWYFLRPLSDPEGFGHADVMSQCVLYFIVLFVYGPIAPLVTFFLSGLFLLQNACYRHQFVYVYPTHQDGGGRLWTNLMTGVIPSCLVIAELTITGLFIFKSAHIAAGLMLPLVFITLSFSLYINKKHAKLTEFLPGREALKADLVNDPSGTMDYEFIKAKYVQPELLVKDLQPENTTVEREIRFGGIIYATPENSVINGQDNDNSDMADKLSHTQPQNRRWVPFFGRKGRAT